MLLSTLPSLRVPLSGRADARTRRRRAWWVAGSVVLHGLVLAGLLVVRRQEPELPMAPSYELLFDNGGSATPPASEQAAMDSARPSQPADTSSALDSQAAPPPAPTPPEPQQLAAAPTPDAAPPPSPPEPDPTPPPEQVATTPAEAPVPVAPLPAPADPTPPVQQAVTAPAEAPTLPVPAPDPSPPVQMAMAPPTEAVPPPPAPQPSQPPPEAALPAPSPPALPAVRLAQPDEFEAAPRPRDLVPNFEQPAPPPPLPPPVVPRPRPAPPAPRQALGTLGAPMDLNFGQASSRAPAPRGSAGSRAIDFSLGTPKAGPNRSEAFFDARAANVGADWAQGLADYWRRHRFYPQQAAENGEDGTVQVTLVVNRLGRVQSVEVKSRSGSPWLDMAAVSVWRNAQLAPLPAENPNPTITIPLTINYILLR